MELEAFWMISGFWQKKGDAECVIIANHVHGNHRWGGGVVIKVLGPDVLLFMLGFFFFFLVI